MGRWILEEEEEGGAGCLTSDFVYYILIINSRTQSQKACRTGIECSLLRIYLQSGCSSHQMP